MADLFGFGDQNIKTPLTADKAIITWGGGIVTGALNIAISYAQPIQRKRTIGNKDVVIYAGMPSGQITMAQLLTTDASKLFSSPGWQACAPTEIQVSFGGGCGAGGGGGFSVTAKGCVVAQFQIQAEAEGLTVVDNVMIEFLQLTAG